MSKPLALVIEDHPDSGDIFCLTLKVAGFQTKLIDSGDKVFAWLATKVPDVIIVDVGLPRVSGADILRQIRADPRLAKTPVIVATAYPKSAALPQEYANLVLIKPISPRQLRNLATQLTTDRAACTGDKNAFFSQGGTN